MNINMNINMNMNTNVQIYKKIGSLVFYKYEHAHAISFKCTGLVESQEIDYSFLYGIMNNNNLVTLESHLEDVASSAD